MKEKKKRKEKKKKNKKNKTKTKKSGTLSRNQTRHLGTGFHHTTSLPDRLHNFKLFFLIYFYECRTFFQLMKYVPPLLMPMLNFT